MGGNALKNTETRRYESEEYYNLVEEVINKFDIFLYNRVEVIQSYNNKESFGDMDILYSTYDDNPISKSCFRQLFQPNELVQNTNVISLDYKQFQIDFIHVSKEEFDYALNYFGNNDLGNLIGKIARQFGLKHGHNGLFLPLRDGNNMFAEVILTLDYNKSLEFLGLDVDRYKQGFNELSDIFEFVSKSPYFNPDKYKLENLSNKGRVRDKKRTTYQEFLKYCETLTGEYWISNEDKTVYFEHIFFYYPEAYEDYKIQMARLAMVKYSKEKFNGDIVSNLTGLTDKDLGKFMSYIKDDFNFRKENIVYLSPHRIERNILHKFKFYKT